MLGRFNLRLIRARRKPFVTIVFSHSAPIMHHLVAQLQIAPRSLSLGSA
jgi:hypothetical protein